MWTEFKRIPSKQVSYHVTPVGQPYQEPSEIYENNLYQVLVRRSKCMMEGMPNVIHLSIRRIDRSADHDWRHLQRIKNEILGPEFEAVELYPAESRLVDTSNQYHLWAFEPTEGKQFMFPFGYGDRLVTKGDKGVTKQRPFEQGFEPDDCQELSAL